MSKATMMLAKNLDYKKIEYPVVVSEKLDGVPGDFFGNADGSVSVQTRSGEPILSVKHIQDWLYGMLPEGVHVIGELYIQGKSFKDIGGLVRRQAPSPELVLNVFDYYVEHRPWMTYIERMIEFVTSPLGRYIDINDDTSPVQLISGTHIENEAELKKHIATFIAEHPESEGLIIRPTGGKNSLYEPNKRSWGFQRAKAEETVDLRILGFEEATSESGEPKGMVGRILCDYNGRVIGVGPGALKHGERIFIFHNQDTAIGKIIEVAYKPDPTYEALREARFKQFRHDKTEPNTD